MSNKEFKLLIGYENVDGMLEAKHTNISMPKPKKLKTDFVTIDKAIEFVESIDGQKEFFYHEAEMLKNSRAKKMLVFRDGVWEIAGENSSDFRKLTNNKKETEA